MIRHQAPVVLSILLGSALIIACGSSSDAPTPAVIVTAPPAASLPTLLAAATLGCGVPSLPDLRNTCPSLEPRYLNDVRAAVQHVMSTRPDLVEPSGRVLDHRAYTNSVVQRLHALGYCAVDQLEEIAVKRTNEFNEQYNVWTSLGYVRMSYITTCFPAQF